MKQVQEALKGIGIPVMAGVWRATSANQNPPVQYVVYSTTTTEASHQDDVTTSYRTFVYLNLWSDIDPTEMAAVSARRCMPMALPWWKSRTRDTTSPPMTPPPRSSPCSGRGAGGRR